MLATSLVVFVLAMVLISVAWISRKSMERFLFYFAGYFMGADVQSRVNLTSAVDSHTLVTPTGDLVTYFRIQGAQRLIGPADFDAMAEKVADLMRITMIDGSGKQHVFAVGYLSDPHGTHHVIRSLLQPAVATAQRMGANKHAKTWFDARAKFLGEICNDESIILAVYTLKSGLTPKESERYAQWMQQTREKVRSEAAKLTGQKASVAKSADTLYNQNIHPVYPVLQSRHTALLQNLESSMRSSVGIIMHRLESKEALYVLRRFIDGAGVPPNWRPEVFGDKAPRGSELERDDDLANVMPAAIARQLITEPMHEVFEGFEMVKREGVWYGSMKMDICPQEEPNPSFSNLVDRLGRQFPFSVSFEISPNGMQHKKMDQTFSSVFGGFGAHNRAMRDAWRELKAMDEGAPVKGQAEMGAERKSEYVAALRMVATTWAKTEEELSDQLSTLKMVLQSWGSCTVSNESGSPINLLLASAPTVARYNPAPYLPGPVSCFSRMLPIYRAASPWSTGQLLLRNAQGKPYPVAFGSTIQAFWGSLVLAPPGRGKSFLLNCLNAGLFFSAGQSDLPYVMMIDKGMSSANAIEFARGILPESRRHQAVSIRLRNTVEYAINIFDTHLGLDQPTPRDREFQVNMVSTLCPTLGIEGVAFIGLVIDTAYEMMGRESLSARRWQRAYSEEITDRLIADGMQIDNENPPRIWDVVDRLFDMGDPHSATMAQRYAVPTLSDLVVAANSDVVRDMYGNTPAANGQEMMIQVFIRSITTATKEYALISTHTRFDIGDARVISVDLEEVLASATSDEGRRRAAVMMLFARQLGARNFFLKWDEMEKIVPPRYRRYQETRVKTIFETLKFMMYDEFHNATGMVDLQRMVETDFREGRKYNVVPLLSSQLFEDFSPSLVDTASNYFVLGVGSVKAAKAIQETFGLSDAERLAIENDCLGPTAKGAPLFAMFKTEEGTVSQLLYNSANSMEQWAFNSSAMDVAVRQAVVAGLGGNYWWAIKGLAELFPRGTARHEIERMRMSMAADEQADEDGIAATLAKRVVLKIQETVVMD